MCSLPLTLEPSYATASSVDRGGAWVAAAPPELLRKKLAPF